MNNEKKLLICSNVTLNPIDTIINEKEKIFDLEIGDFDNIWIQAINTNVKNIFIHCDILNVGQEIRSKFNDSQYCKKIDKFLIEQLLKLKKQAIAKNQNILFSTMSEAIFSNGNFYKNINLITQNFNQFVLKNFQTINLDFLISSVGLKNSFRSSNFYRYSAPYTINFLENLSDCIIKSFTRDHLIKKKVLILDCDNTIWKGILGEDGEENIEYKDTSIGNCFFEVQQSAINLVKKGVLLCLCTKNNHKDLEKLLKKNLMPINMKNTTIIKANWNDKSENIKEIAKELNLGIDSFIFVDDSNYEISEVRSKLPMLKVCKVPENTYDYPGFFRNNITNFFNNDNLTKEDKNRVNYYKNEIKRTEHSSKFKDKNKFIDSLKLKLKIFSDNQNKNYIKRISQMTQKTNQFNLTTKRYKEQDIKKFLKNKNIKIFTGDVSDKFGDHGKTILVILKKENDFYFIDTFLMSCRVIGRQLEKVFFDSIFKKIKSKKHKIIGTYIQTQKNEQVKGLYKKLGFHMVQEKKNLAEFIFDPSKHVYKCSERKIKVINGK